MSKSKNIKRAKMLRQKKKEQEQDNNSKKNTIQGITKIKNRLEKSLNTKVKLNYKNNNKGRKISDVVSEMLKPLLKEARTFDEEKNAIGLGIMAWNLGVIKTYRGEKEMLEALETFKMKLPVHAKELLLEFSKIKYEYYDKYNQFIIDYEFSKLNNHQNNLTVTYETIKK